MTQITQNIIVTVGVCPCWDRTIYVDGIEWGQHKEIVSQTCVPAGKALNISRALSGVGINSIAAGLWGQSDYPPMLENISSRCPHITPHFTVVPGQTRTNITIVDRRNKRDFHLRAECQLAAKDSLKRLENDIKSLTMTSVVVFAGSLPEAFFNQIMSIMDLFRQSGARLFIDTSGTSLKAVVKRGRIALIKPNFQELCQLLGRDMDNNADSIIPAARSLCDSVSIVLVSRGIDGILFVTKQEAIECRVNNIDPRQVTHTVGCGDYLLAGFLSQIDGNDTKKALSTAVRVAAARAWGWTEIEGWDQTIKSLEVKFREY